MGPCRKWSWISVFTVLSEIKKKTLETNENSSRKDVKVNSNLYKSVCKRTCPFFFPKADELVEFICGKEHKNDSRKKCLPLHLDTSFFVTAAFC